MPKLSFVAFSAAGSASGGAAAAEPAPKHRVDSARRSGAAAWIQQHPCGTGSRRSGDEDRRRRAPAPASDGEAPARPRSFADLISLPPSSAQTPLSTNLKYPPAVRVSASGANADSDGGPRPRPRPRPSSVACVGAPVQEAARAPRHTGGGARRDSDVHVDYGGLPTEILEHVLAFVDTWTKGSCAQVCRAWAAAARARAVWRNACVVIRNPVWVKTPRGLELSTDQRAYGAAVFLETDLKAQLCALGVAQALLAGPNVQHEPEHLLQLACEMPQLRRLTLFRCVLSAKSAGTLAAFKHLEHLVLIGGWSQRRLAQLSSELRGLRRLTLVACEVTDKTASVLAANIGGLQQLDFRACHNRDGSGRRGRQSANFGATLLHMGLSECAAFAPRLRVTCSSNRAWLQMSRNAPRRVQYTHSGCASAHTHPDHASYTRSGCASAHPYPDHAVWRAAPRASADDFPALGARGGGGGPQCRPDQQRRQHDSAHDHVHVSPPNGGFGGAGDFGTPAPRGGVGYAH